MTAFMDIPWLRRQFAIEVRVRDNGLELLDDGGSESQTASEIRMRCAVCIVVRWTN